MLTLCKQNVNPKGRVTSDCTTRAMSNVLGISYADTLRLQYEQAMKHCYGLCDGKTTDFVMKLFGYEKQKQPRKWNNTKYTVGELDQLLSKKQMSEGVLVTVNHHETCIREGQVRDTWNCLNKYVGNYWIKTSEEDPSVKSIKRIEHIELGKKGRKIL